MLHIFKLAFILAFAAFCFASIQPKSCRRCSGAYDTKLNRASLYDDAKKFVMATLNVCATGGEIALGVPTKLGCNAASLCTNWSWPITTWRWCGNGGKVSFDRPETCNGTLCGAANLQTTCNKSVVCHSECRCIDCAC